MNKLWLLFLLVIPYQSIHAQDVEHAPTVAQCQADQRLWLSKLEDPSGAELADVTFLQLADWAREMVACMSVDPQFEREYVDTGSEANARSASRLLHFITRHNLYNQFIAEDAHGKR